MRIAYAWLLLVVTLSNWVGGFLYFEINQYIEVRYEMNAIEQEIAAAVEVQLGAESIVKTLDQEPRLKGDVYGDVAFATEIADETVYYTLVNDVSILQKITQSTNNPASSDTNNAFLLKCLLQEFEVTAYNFSFSSALTSYTSNFYFKSYATQSYTSILIPPPNVA